MNESAEIAAGLVEAADAPVVAEVTDALRIQLNPTTVWQSAYLPTEMRGQVAYGEDLAQWSSHEHVTSDQAEQLQAAWSDALPSLDLGMSHYLRLRVKTGEDVKRLREIGEVDGLAIAPSLESRGARRPFRWRWPLRVAVGGGRWAEAWLATMRDDRYSGQLYDAELFDAAETYDIVIVDATDLSSMADDLALRLGEAACVIVVGDGLVETMLADLDSRIEPAIAIAVNRPPAEWWRVLFAEMSHDVPIDAAVETVVKVTDADAIIAGPRRGLDITAAGRWFAAVAPEIPELAKALDDLNGWYWTYESEGATDATEAVRSVRAQGIDPVATVGWEEAAVIGGPATNFESFDIDTPAETPVQPRRLVARAFDGDTVVKSILPPKRPLLLGIRIAIPETGDVAADEPAPPLPGDGPTVNLDVVVSSDVWAQQPDPQPITISRQKLTQPSTWARFPFTTPDEGAVVNIEVRVLYQGKPLQAATYTSPVASAGLPGERPTLTTFVLSGPDEPTEELRFVDLALDGTGAELKRIDDDGSKVLITDVRAMLDSIELQVSRVLGVTGAPDSLDDPQALGLLITLAGIGTELRTSLEPLGIGDARSINVTVNPDTRVLPLELVYAGPPPTDDAQLCDHVANPPPPGEPCNLASAERVCPYAFWGLHRSIARTIRWKPDGTSTPPWTTTIAASSVLYGVTAIADEGSSQPLPSASVLATARSLFKPVKTARTWDTWLKRVEQIKPNLLVVLGHTEGTGTSLSIGTQSVLERKMIAPPYLRAEGSPRPLVLLIACATAALGDVFGSLPGTLTAKGAGAVVGTLSKIVGPQGAAAAMHLLHAVRDLSGKDASVGDAVAAARQSLLRERRPIGLVLVSHGEMDTKLVKQ